MREDLKILNITESEISQLIGIKAEKKITDFIYDFFSKLLGYFTASGVVVVGIAIFLNLFFDAIIGYNHPTFLAICFFTIILAVYVTAKEMKTNNIESTPKTEVLIKLLKEVENFNQVVKAIDVNDQLEEAGNKGISLNDRNKAIEVLTSTRKNLVRALKTEKILRENQEVIINNQEIFTISLSSLESLEVNQKATETCEILSQALQIAIDVQEEIKNLKNRHSA
ncbi:hypothetical protein [Planktothrix agardhii]|uniref:hypothetical protein n=1 Tax=Planktothrix agardhii TaxID=1160 RepID=UPI001F36F901|nr:hypothetical protein [Planktothrix agardhii]MCF3579121.1 hypothetical protein [Planktothrix agardhii 1811]